METQYTVALDGPHAFLRETRTPVSNGVIHEVFNNHDPADGVAPKVRLWYLNLRTADREYVDVPDDDFSITRAMHALQAKAHEVSRSDQNRKPPDDKLGHTYAVPEPLKTLYNGEYGKECRRRRAA